MGRQQMLAIAVFWFCCSVGVSAIGHASRTAMLNG